jgi:hypothetical protein
MSIELNPKETEFREKIEELMGKIKTRLKENRVDDVLQNLIDEMGNTAHQLHISLKSRNYEPKHHNYMIKNRGVQPDDPQFYMHVHPVEDLLTFIENPHANDDSDITIGEEFEFIVYSRRWNHEDAYSVMRTENGWDVYHESIGGPCDKGGHPFLFDNFHQDFIEYPIGFDGWLEWLWEQASSQNLTKEDVQNALNKLGEWVSNTEKNTPSGGLWEGYS